RRPRPADFFDGKGLLEALWARLGLPAFDTDRAELPAALHPGKSVRLLAGGRVVGSLGVLHPDRAQALDARGDVVVAEVELDVLTAAGAPTVRFRPLERFPAVTRDLSVQIDAGVPAARLLDDVRAAGGPFLREVVLADRYEGPPVPPGRVRLTLGLRFPACE